MRTEDETMNTKLQAKDLINVGLFTVLYFVLGCCVAIPIGMVPVFLPILGTLWVIITGIPFMLFLTRVKKFGMVTLMAILSGLLMGLTGMGFWGVPMGVIFGILGDLIIKSGEYKSIQKGILGYAVFSLWMMGTYIPMYFMAEQSKADFASQFNEEYAEKVMSVMPMWSIILVAASIFVFAFVGGYLGKALLKKHFKKAGIA
jgi:energy-coupling factor transport system substrate-specific component